MQRKKTLILQRLAVLLLVDFTDALVQDDLLGDRLHTGLGPVGLGVAHVLQLPPHGLLEEVRVLLQHEPEEFSCWSLRLEDRLRAAVQFFEQPGHRGGGGVGGGGVVRGRRSQAQSGARGSSSQSMESSGKKNNSDSNDRRRR